MSAIQLAEDLRHLAANPLGNSKADAYELLRVVCRRLKFSFGVYARVGGYSRPSQSTAEISFHVQSLFPGRGMNPETPVFDNAGAGELSAEDLQALERWLAEHVRLTDRSTQLEDLDRTMPDHPIHKDSGCSGFIGVPVCDGGELAGVFGFFHHDEMAAWSPFAESTVALMVAWFVERLAREEHGFSMLPAAELEQSRGLAGLEMFRSTSQQFVVVMEPSGQLLEANRALMKFENKGPEEIQGAHLCDLSFCAYLVDGDQRLRAAIAEANEKRSAHRELVMDQRGEGRTFQLVIRRVTHPYTKQVLLLGEILELTEHFRAIQQFEAQLTVLRAVFNQSANFIGLLEPDGSMIIANQRALDFIEDTNDRLRGEKLWDLPWFFDMESTRNRLRQAVTKVAAGGTVRFEILIKGAGSKVMSIEFTMKPLFDEQGRVLFLLPEGHDLSPQIEELNDRMVSEREIHEQTRLQSLGVLAGGVAHDFNNLLTCILGNASLLKMGTALGSENHQMLSEIESAARKSAALCQQMLAFSGHGQISMQPLSISELVGECIPELLVRLGYRGAVELHLDETVPEVVVDRRQIVQLLLELLTNAIEAMEERPDDGRLTIRTHALDERGHAHVVLEVSDNGGGMEDNVLQHACDPFFSTKFTGRGLGLAAVSGIVRGHQGRLEIDPSPTGTSVRVKLPLSMSEGAVANPVRRTEAKAGRILVVDDDVLVQGVVARYLAMLGYEVLLASDGIEALEICKKSRQDISLVLLDLTMPRMDGYEAFNELQRSDPTLPVILMSGYSEKQSVLRFEKNLAGFLPKPLTFEAVKDCLASVLGSRELPAGSATRRVE